MPARGKGKWQRKGLSRARAQFHDYNSQRRFRGQSTKTFAQYRKKQKK